MSYLSNTMSFLRVAAFVLVHAGMMMAVFAIGDIFHTFGYTVAVIVGNILVMGMEAVLVVIQTMRLEYYEMFSRYYTGDGRPFSRCRSGRVKKPEGSRTRTVPIESRRGCGLMKLYRYSRRY